MIEAIIAAGATLLVCLINNWFQSKKANEQHQETVHLLDYRLDDLTKKVEKHNNLVERMYHLEEKFAVHEEFSHGIVRRLDGLEGKD